MRKSIFFCFVLTFGWYKNESWLLAGGLLGRTALKGYAVKLLWVEESVGTLSWASNFSQSNIDTQSSIRHASSMKIVQSCQWLVIRQWILCCSVILHDGCCHCWMITDVNDYRRHFPATLLTWSNSFDDSNEFPNISLTFDPSAYSLTLKPPANQEKLNF
jgi:hypothetical protein